MWLALGGKDDRDEAIGTRGVLDILKVRTKLELHMEKAERLLSIPPQASHEQRRLTKEQRGEWERGTSTKPVVTLL
ncbi:hypothetical protein HGM15179_021228 [Zosterops borbonicus]|uniref:Uncharacterized protein n=1 Tax=Zosterops borbonicus TaxID=364589 RepID=A0A8K1D4W3_9PASS|nr:hypothetical protein HGM15179_021228 [Zosterops borbonicus]